MPVLAIRFDKAENLPTLKRMAERLDWKVQLISTEGTDATVVTTFEESSTTNVKYHRFMRRSLHTGATTNDAAPPRTRSALQRRSDNLSPAARDRPTLPGVAWVDPSRNV
jgi:DNA-binding IclR family transcriptional regulator